MLLGFLTGATAQRRLSSALDRYLLRQSRHVKSEDEQTRVTALAVVEGGETADVGYPITPEIGQHLFLSHVAEFWNKKGAFAGFATFLETVTCLLQKVVKFRSVFVSFRLLVFIMRELSAGACISTSHGPQMADTCFSGKKKNVKPAEGNAVVARLNY